MRQLLLLAAVGVASALEAKWTPASDGGPARFSKRYRDAAGIDDSRWTNDGAGDDAWLSIFPTTPMGWALALVGAVLIFVMLGQPQMRPQAWQAGQRAGGEREEGPAGEAARAAFLKKYAQ